MSTPSVETIAERIKQLVSELNTALTEAAVAGIIVRVDINEAEARNIGPVIEVELLQRL